MIDTQADALPLATILLLPDSTLTTTEVTGQFDVRTTAGYKEVVVSYTGFETLRQRVHVRSDTFLTFVLQTKIAELNEVTVNATRYSSEDLVQSTRTGTTTLTEKDLNGIPTLGGEADLIKTLQLLPGTVRGVEGSSDLFVREHLPNWVIRRKRTNLFSKGWTWAFAIRILVFRPRHIANCLISGRS